MRAVVEPLFSLFATMSVTEAAIGVAVLREPMLEMPRLVERLSRWFERGLERADLLGHVDHMMARDWLRTVEDAPTQYRLTRTGEAAVRAAAVGLLRAVDGDDRRIAAAAAWSVISATSPDEWLRLARLDGEGDAE